MGMIAGNIDVSTLPNRDWLPGGRLDAFNRWLGSQGISETHPLQSELWQTFNKPYWTERDRQQAIRERLAKYLAPRTELQEAEAVKSQIMSQGYRAKSAIDLENQTKLLGTQLQNQSALQSQLLSGQRQMQSDEISARLSEGSENRLLTREEGSANRQLTREEGSANRLAQSRNLREELANRMGIAQLDSNTRIRGIQLEGSNRMAIAQIDDRTRRYGIDLQDRQFGKELDFRNRSLATETATHRRGQDYGFIANARNANAQLMSSAIQRRFYG